MRETVFPWILLKDRGKRKEEVRYMECRERGQEPLCYLLLKGLELYGGSREVRVVYVYIHIRPYLYICGPPQPNMGTPNGVPTLDRIKGT